ncbi:response regulator [Pseudomonas sp. S75]|uniref:response regulator n=1 Tax=unclassified Pseudomonas TaxID=196821 RepID=UPI001908E1D2|nr:MULTISPECIES: response regulator [unclassified Pseudomonas]MBJ9974201.1 response regulator [Pseudomonas sp. S30]MBK0151869.1 response regulator [Pseudomonas sp. S75]
MSMQYGSSLPGIVMVVEDDELLRSLMVEAVATLGYETAEFSTADDALIYALRPSTCISLVLTDLTVPGQLDGIDLARLLRQRIPGLPVIITSGFIGANRELDDWIEFLPKPWSMWTLTQMVDRLVSPQTEG